MASLSLISEASVNGPTEEVSSKASETVFWSARTSERVMLNWVWSWWTSPLNNST